MVHTETKLKSIKYIATPSELPVHIEQEGICFMFVQQKDHELWVLIYNAVEIKVHLHHFFIGMAFFFVHTKEFTESIIPC